MGIAPAPEIRFYSTQKILLLVVKHVEIENIRALEIQYLEIVNKTYIQITLDCINSIQFHGLMLF